MVMIVGHRGARNLWPENSLGGFRKLLDLDVEAVEFDVQATRDGGLVVIHDPTLDRTTDRQGAIRALAAADVVTSRLRAMSGSQTTDECVPSLDEVLSLLRGCSLELHVEIKTDAVGELAASAVEDVVQAVHRHGLQERAILTSFVPEVLEQVRERWADARLLASLDHRSAEMLGGIERALARYAAMPGCIVAVEKTLLAATWSRCLAVLGSERLGVWVVNEPSELARWVKMPLRQITTDRPDLALAERERLRNEGSRSA